jgi:predicted RNA polymerase sigma factor
VLRRAAAPGVADLLARLDRGDEAASAYDWAIELATNAAERRFLTQRRDGAVKS